ncbi:hypothetical protein AB0D54_24460 [Streptomyces xanthophaeus]|uniref:hypothetical protein n=1 Tax=Streptomyces xanthophaeus TaxID=67385 RepID=UPI0034251903
MARDPVAHVCLSRPDAVAEVLHELRWDGQYEAVAQLTARGPVAHLDLTDPRFAVHLLRRLREAEESEAAAAQERLAVNAGMREMCRHLRPQEGADHELP